jgi:S-adenosylmethionine:tRNA ribosyltransferase-isomerase
MLVRDFDFELPPELIAQEPAADRGSARLLCLDRTGGAIRHRSVAGLPELLHPGDVLVVNNTRVFPARLLGRRFPGGGKVECLLIGRVEEQPAAEPGDGELWEALMHPGQRLRAGTRVCFDGAHTLEGEVLELRFHGRRIVRLWTKDTTPVDAAIDAIGHVPLPPYVKRPDRPDDRERYQTVFARERGSVAAPTAGLHLSPSLLRQLVARGVELVEITLHVGYGTFQPIRVDRVESHRLHGERYEVGAPAAVSLNRALDQGRRIVAVGTTTTRTVEAVALANGGRVAAGRGSTDLFIYPGFRFQVVGGLLTNFHLPQSSLLMLVCAFAGRERVLDAYRAAIAERYRFYSYGDAMLVQ